MEPMDHATTDNLNAMTTKGLERLTGQEGSVIFYCTFFPFYPAVRNNPKYQ